VNQKRKATWDAELLFDQYPVRPRHRIGAVALVEAAMKLTLTFAIGLTGRGSSDELDARTAHHIAVRNSVTPRVGRLLGFLVLCEIS
jgi:hypothetical protein